MATGYEDIDRLTNQQNNLINEQERKQNELINQQTQMQVDELNREKDKIEQNTIKTTKGLYSNWQKQANQYGANAEQLAQQGLAHSGYAETTQTALYNTYQKNVTETLNNARDLKSDYDFKVQQARQNGSVQQAQAALDLYKQKAQLLTQNYELRQNREQYLYQQERDRVSDNQWQKTFDQQARQNEIENQWKQKSFDYQKQEMLFLIVNGKRILIIKKRELLFLIINGKSNMNCQKKNLVRLVVLKVVKSQPRAQVD